MRAEHGVLGVGGIIGGDVPSTADLGPPPWHAPAMAFTIYARGPTEEGSQEPHTGWETYPFTDVAEYTILPSGVLIVDKDGNGSCWVLTPDRWQWLRSTDHAPGVEGNAGGGQFGSVF